jgi:peptidoglycan/xylan/chitin deacetylase (PgdA/CDA1 family)
VERILDTLSEADTPATFFVQGRWAESQPLAAKRIADQGHLIGHHSHYHARMPLLHDDGLKSDLLDAQSVIERTTGANPKPWFRCPFGAGSDDQRVLGVLDELGYRNVHWHVESEDWEPWRTGDAIASDTIRGVVDHGDGSVVLLHTWPGGTADGIGSIVTELRDAGATFVTIDELEDLP